MACIEEVLRGVERYQGCYQASIEMQKNMNFQERKSMKSKQIRLKQYQPYIKSSKSMINHSNIKLKRECIHNPKALNNLTYFIHKNKSR